jgi:hypothetical protein
VAVKVVGVPLQIVELVTAMDNVIGFTDIVVDAVAVQLLPIS